MLLFFGHVNDGEKLTFLCCKSHGTLQQIKNNFYFYCLTGIN